MSYANTSCISVWNNSYSSLRQVIPGMILLTPSVTVTFGREHTNWMLEMRSEGDDGGWIGDTLPKPAPTITKQVLTWNPQEKEDVQEIDEKGISKQIQRGQVTVRWNSKQNSRTEDGSTGYVPWGKMGTRRMIHLVCWIYVYRVLGIYI